MELATEHVRMLDAGRQHISYSSPLTTDCFASVASKKTQLLQHGNTYGLSFVALEKGFMVAKHDAFEASCHDYIKRRQEAVDHGQKLTLEEIYALPAAKEVHLPSIAYWIALSPDELTVAVAYGDSVALFEVAHILEVEAPTPFQTFSTLQVQEIAWCTEPSSELFAVLTMEKQVILCSLAGEKDTIEAQSASASMNDELEFVGSPTLFEQSATRSVVVQEPGMISKTANNVISHEYGQNDENEFAESDGEDSDEEEER
ncbi:hypothetical protein JM18_008071, partial [Phytophthora kernoviae]